MRTKELDEAVEFYLKEGVSIQELRHELPYAIKNFEYKKENFYENSSGLKIKTGEPQEDGTAVIVFDIDCKEAQDIGKQVFLNFIQENEALLHTRREVTKSGGYHIFLRIPIGTYKDIGKVVFTSPKEFESDPFRKPVEIEVFLNEPITVAPTLVKTGCYYLSPTVQEIKEVDLDEFRKIMSWLADNTITYKILEKGNNKRIVEPVAADSTEVQEVLSVLDANGINYKRDGKSWYVWEPGDTSGKGDWVINKNRMLWNMKSHERASLKEFVLKTTGGYKPGKIIWG